MESTENFNLTDPDTRMMRKSRYAGYVKIEVIEELNTETNCNPYFSLHSEDARKERSYDYRPNKKSTAKLIKDHTLKAMREKLSTPEGKAIYKLRSQTVETVFRVIKEVIGFRSFLLRDCEKMAGEWALACISYNQNACTNSSTWAKVTRATPNCS